MSEQKRFILWGSSGHAKVLNDLISVLGWRVVALFDNDPHAIAAIPNVPLYIGEDGFLEWKERERDVADIYGLAAIGGAHGADRLSVYDIFRSSNIRIPSVVHPQASVCDLVRIGEGSQILAQSVVSSEAKIGRASIINHGAIVDHQCVLGDGVHLAPHATLCGCVSVGENTMIGAGAVVLPRVIIGAHSIVGAGSVVTRDLPSHVLAIGSPAKIVRNICL